MSLLGRLEDLSLADIIQIVHLSRRTGVLEVLQDGTRHAILFRNGLVVNATAPGVTKVPSPLHEEALREHILSIIAPLLQSRGGEFNFLLADELPEDEVGYDPSLLLEEGGFSPQKILTVAGERLKPLQDLEESMRRGMDLLRRSPTAAQFRVAGGLTEIESPEASTRNVVLFERDPLVRVAARRAFGGRMKVAQFGSLDGRARRSRASSARTPSSSPSSTSPMPRKGCCCTCASGGFNSGSAAVRQTQHPAPDSAAIR